MSNSIEGTNKQKLHGLDHLRALAIILVFLFHYFILSGGKPTWLPDVARFGWTGVDLFFVLSGFLISSQLFAEIQAQQSISFKQFFVKRFFRIIPAYVATIILYFCIPIFREKESLPPLWKFLTFTQNLGLNIKDYGTFSHCWSLCVEEHFYLFLPLLLLLLQNTRFFKKAYWILILVFVLGFSTRIYSFNYLYMPQQESEIAWMYWYKYIYYPTYNRLDGLVVGVIIAALYNFSPKVWAKMTQYGNILIFLGLAFMTAAYLLCYEQMIFNASIFGFPLIAIGYGFIVMGAISPSCFLYKWKSGITTFIATVSYSIYLTHKGVIHVTHKILSNNEIDSNWVLLICITTCLIAAYLIHLAIEKPFMKFRYKILAATPK